MCGLLLLEGDKMWNQMKKKRKEKIKKGLGRDWYLKKGELGGFLSFWIDWLLYCN